MYTESKGTVRRAPDIRQCLSFLPSCAVLRFVISCDSIIRNITRFAFRALASNKTLGRVCSESHREAQYVVGCFHIYTISCENCQNSGREEWKLLFLVLLYSAIYYSGKYSYYTSRPSVLCAYSKNRRTTAFPLMSYS